MLLQRGDDRVEPASRLGRIDWWGPLLAAIGVLIFLLHGFGGLLTRDLALYAYGGQQFAEGVPPYVGVLNRAGPLAHMVPGFGAMIARALGTDDLITMRVLMMVLSTIAVWLTYLLGRDTFRSRLAGVAAAATLLTFQGFVTYATGGPREKTTMMLMVVCALLAVVHRRWAWAGVAVALATLTWQPAFVAGTVAAVTAVLVGLPGRRKIGGLAVVRRRRRRGDRGDGRLLRRGRRAPGVPRRLPAPQRHLDPPDRADRVPRAGARGDDRRLRLVAVR